MNKILLINDNASDLAEVLKSCAEVSFTTAKEAIYGDISCFDSYCVFGNYKPIDTRLRIKLEAESEKGKKIFLEAVESWSSLYCAPPVSTVRSRLIAIDDSVPGLEAGDLLDDEDNLSMRPWYNVPEIMSPLLVYREHIIAHDRLKDADSSDLINNSECGLWKVGENVIMSSFVIHNFNRARFSPRASWQKVIRFLAKWLTESLPTFMPEPIVTHRIGCSLSDDSVFENQRKQTLSLGIEWLKNYLVDDGDGGILEGLKHNIDSEGIQEIAQAVRTDCVGEAAGALRFFGALYSDDETLVAADKLESFVFGPMMVKGGLFDGMIRWTESAFEVCYQDDVARAILPTLYSCLFLNKKEHLNDACSALDFLVKTTAKDGCRIYRTDAPMLSEKKIKELSEADHGLPSAHYNAYYHAALLLAYQCCKNEKYLEVARKGIETLMSLYPDTKREQSETEEMCRLILPLALLYDVTGEEEHKQMLYRVTNDLVKHKHSSGGYYEWDTDYKANCSRESSGECSLLTDNGDPIADLLYSCNWLPVGFAMAYKSTKDKMFYDLWRSIAEFCINTQVLSRDKRLNGSWCRAFDLERGEVYGCPHDVGWAANCIESGWTVSEILMGLMLPDILNNLK